MKNKKINYYRIFLQWVILILLAYMFVRPYFDRSYTADFEAYCPFGGMQALSSYIVSGTLACSMTSLQISIGIALIIAVILFSKLFCSFICPVGTFTEWLGRIGEKFKIRYTIKGIADRLLRILKYALLFITFYFTIESSELFCKKYDPYYAAFSGFSSDVVVLYGIITLLVVVLGSIFIRLFWCKYLCPLSAATNIFSNFILFALATGIYLILILVFKRNISWIWYLGGITTLAFLTESVLLRTKVFPLFKITRNPDACTLCRKCDKVCPMAIKVSESGPVDHIDCHMCGDCIVHCPELDVLKINRRKIRWLPPVMVVLLTAAAIWYASYTEIPTISERWGSPDEIERAEVFTMTGLKNVKCFGSSVSFVEQVKDIEGILGVETFVGTHTVKIWYNPSVINEEQIKAAIFTPSKFVISDPSPTNKIGFAEIKIQNYFDSYDEYYLTQLFLSSKAIFGLSTSFGEPINAVVYFDPEQISVKQIASLIESDRLIIKNGDSETSYTLNFKVSAMNEKYSVISYEEFFNEFFPPIDDTFNKFDSWPLEDLSNYEIPIIPFGQIEAQNLTYLESHASGDDGVVGMKSYFRNDTAFVSFVFVKSKTEVDKINSSISKKKFTIYYSDGTSEEIDNVYDFKSSGKIVE